MKIAIEFITTFILIYVMYLITVILRKKNKDKLKSRNEIVYLERKYKLKIKDIEMQKLNHLIALANSFIITLTFVIVNLIENVFLKILVGFLMLSGLLIIIYHFIGKYYQKKERITKDV